jgi:predicted RNA-binding protein with PIN domain
MSTVVADAHVADTVAVEAPRPLLNFAWAARDEDAEKRCEREVARALSLRARLLGWLIEYNKY